ncbi:MAG: bifunctional folylpolyglutamate synthase/dihydrofolate synthase [Oscillospiraceae bacterium]|nr:bifunctional folylpolyglutamate synthase/dihydrofolate synthase [Oscillospiraceae bacterium]
MKYEKVLKEIKSLKKFGIKLGLDRIKNLLKILDNPHKSMKYLHVAGTNGKGSVCTMMSFVLREAGYKTGLFISPFIKDFREMITINGKKIFKKDIVRIYKMFNFALKENKDCATEFEVISTIAFKWFKENNCDIVILETGIGGKFDSTNVIDSALISVITAISYDHTKILGNTLEKITREKCGIIKENGKTVIYPDEDPCVFFTINEECRKMNNLAVVADYSRLKIVEKTFLKTTVKFDNFRYELPLIGTHQLKNLSLVLTVLDELKKEDFKISQKDKYNGILKTKISSRLEVLSNNPKILLDGAHNLQSISCISDFIKEYLGKKNVFAIFSMFKDKDYVSCIKKITPFIKLFVIVKLNNKRACNPLIIKEYIEKFKGKVLSIENTVNEAICVLLKKCKKEDVILIFGSFYLSTNFKQQKKIRLFNA